MALAPDAAHCNGAVSRSASDGFALEAMQSRNRFLKDQTDPRLKIKLADFVFLAISSAICLLLLAWYYVASRSGFEPDPSSLIVGRDFINMYVGGGLIADGNVAPLYSQNDYTRVIREMYGEDYPVHNWSYPPTLFWPAMLFSQFEYYLSLSLWILFGASLMLLTTRVLGLNPIWALVIFLSPAGVLNLVAGQNGYVTAALMTLAFAFAAQRPAISGLNWAILTMKPHLGLVALPLLFFNRQWRVIIFGGTAFLLLVGSTLVVWGVEPWKQFLSYTTRQQRVVLENWDGLMYFIVPTGFMQGRLWGIEISSSYILHALIAGVGTWLAWRAWPDRATELRRLLTWFVVTTFLILPYSFLYDLVVFQIVLVLWIKDPEALFILKPSTSRILWKLFWMLPFLSFSVADTTSIQIGPIVFAFMLWRLGSGELKHSQKHTI